MNLYGYAAGDPVNLTDSFGLCPDTSSVDGKEACEAQAAEAAEIAAAWATCSADLRQLAVSVGLSATGLGAVKFLKSVGGMARSATGFSARYGTFMRNAVGLGPVTAIGAFESADGGTPTYAEGRWGVLYELGKAAPVVSIGVEMGEAAYSCREARRLESARRYR